MSARSCPRESEVLALVRSGRTDTLAGHLTACEPCRTLARTAAAIAAEASRAVANAPVPSSGLVWWRVQNRARQEAMQAASRAVTLVQALSVGAGLFVTFGIVRAMAPLTVVQGQKGLLVRIADGLQPVAAEITSFASVPLLLAVATCLLLAPVAVYFAVARD